MIDCDYIICIILVVHSQTDLLKTFEYLRKEFLLYYSMSGLTMTECVEIWVYTVSIYSKKNLWFILWSVYLLYIRRIWRSYLSLESVITASVSLNKDFLKTNRNEIPCISLFRNLSKKSQHICPGLM